MICQFVQNFNKLYSLFKGFVAMQLLNFFNKFSIYIRKFYSLASPFYQLLYRFHFYGI